MTQKVVSNLAINSRQLIVVMGVGGAGKTTVGSMLAEVLDLPYNDADSFHPPANIKKMAEGSPLDDRDRWPWLLAIGEHLKGKYVEGTGGVVSASALKRIYREQIRVAPIVRFLHLKVGAEVVEQRLNARPGHFFTVDLMQSQFDLLEPLEVDERGITLDASLAPAQIVENALEALGDGC